MLKSAEKPVFTHTSGSGGDEGLGSTYGEFFSDGSIGKHLRSKFYEPNVKMDLSPQSPQRTFWLTLKLVITQGRI